MENSIVSHQRLTHYCIDLLLEGLEEGRDWNSTKERRIYIVPDDLYVLVSLRK